MRSLNEKSSNENDSLENQENIAPTDEDKPVDPKVKAGLEAASWTADKAVKVSGFLGKKILIK